MAENDVVIRVRIEDEDTARFFNELGEEIGSIDQSTEQAAGGFSRLEARLVTLNSAASLAGMAFGALVNSFSGLVSSISQGANIDDISSSFENLAKQAGASGDALLGKLNTALSNTIPNVQLMQQANELLIGGLKPDEIENVAIAARAFGEATGVDATQGMNALADSLLRGNDRALKTLGIVVDNKKAEEEYAASLGKTRDKLSEQERVLATRQATLTALAAETNRLGQVTDDAGDKMAQISTAISNARNEFLQAAATNKTLNEALASLAQLIQSIDFRPIISGLASVVGFAAAAIKELSEFAGAVAAFTNKTSAFDRFIARNTGGFQEFDDKLQDIIETLSQDTPAATKKAITEYNKLGQIFNAMVKQGDLLDSQVNLLNEEFFKTGQEVQAAAKHFGFVSKNAAPELADKLKDIASAAQAAGTAAANLGTAVTDGVTKAAQAAKETPIEVPVVISAERTNISEIVGGGGGGFLDSLLGPATQSFSNVFRDSLGPQIVQGIQQGITEGFSPENIKGMTSGLLKTIPNFFGAQLTPLGGALVDLGVNFLGDAIESIFGGEHAGTTARKAADKFFADAFDANRLSVVIDGQLTQIEDLVFKGDTLFGGNSQFTDGSFDNFFATLPQQAQEAFGGVGLAFEELLGVSEDISGQIGAVLANNIGGSLNNLQLLVEASGKSFEELKGAVVEAFLDGKISALEAQTAMNGLAQAAQKGIPDAIGATVQAFQNLKDAGSKGGRAVIDALKDIGYEAQELNITTLPALMAQLAASGQFTAQEIDQVFAALAAQGIDTIEELTAATNEQLIGALSQLQAQEFPFAAAADDAQQLVDTLDNLPSEKNLTINIKTNLDSNTREAINSNLIPSGVQTAGAGVSA